MPVCKLCYLGHASMCPVASWEAEQAAPCDALVPGGWQRTTHAVAATQAFGASAPKRPCLCAICAKQAMHLRVLLPTERVNRLHHATHWCLGAGNASHTQLNATFALSSLVHPHSHASMCPLASCEAEQAAHHAMLWCLGAGNAPRTPRQ